MTGLPARLTALVHGVGREQDGDGSAALAGAMSAERAELVADLEQATTERNKQPWFSL